MSIITSNPNEAAVVNGPSGTRYYIGECGYYWPCFEQLTSLDLRVRSLSFDSGEVECKGATQVRVKGLALYKVHAWDYDETGKLRVSDKGQPIKNEDQLYKANQNCTDRTEEDLAGEVEMILIGSQKHALAQCTMEETITQRSKLIALFKEDSKEPLEKLGWLLVSYTVVEVEDITEIMLNKGKVAIKQKLTAAKRGENENKVQIEKAEAQFQSLIDRETARYEKDRTIVTNEAQIEIQESNKALRDIQLDCEKIVAEAQEMAQQALEAEKQKQEKARVMEEEEQKLERSKILRLVAEQESLQQQRIAEGESLAARLKIELESEARLYREQRESMIKEMKAKAQSFKIGQEGEAAANVQKFMAGRITMFC